MTAGPAGSACEASLPHLSSQELSVVDRQWGVGWGAWPESGGLGVPALALALRAVWPQAKALESFPVPQFPI